MKDLSSNIIGEIKLFFFDSIKILFEGTSLSELFFSTRMVHNTREDQMVEKELDAFKFNSFD